MDNQKTEVTYKKSNLIKFVIFAIIGFVMFLLPVQGAGGITVVTGIIADYVQAILGDIILWFAVILVVVTAVVTLIACVAKPKFITESKFLSGLFITGPIYIVSRIIGAVFIVMCAFNVGPEMIISANTGQTMLGIMYPLVGIILAISFFMPFLTDYGLMEFIGVFMSKITRPLFKLPGRSAIDLVTSWLGASNAAVILTTSQYEKGFYTKREAATIITAFSAVNIPFCLVVAETVGVEAYFVQLYATLTIIGVILAFITPRIPPLSRFPDEYNPNTGKNLEEVIPSDAKPFKWACKMASDKAENFSFPSLFKGGLKMMANIYVTTLPIVMAWGVIATIIVEYTPVFDVISYPFGWFMDILGFEDAYAAAPATITGFIDMYLPALLVINVPSIATRWAIATLSLIQIIFMTEVGILAMQAKVNLNVWNLLIIFLERTIISLPLLAVAVHIVF